jgi:type III restriction enzyme
MAIDHLIINSPYQEPKSYWKSVRETRSHVLAYGRRPAGYVVATPQSKAFDDPGIFVEIPLVNAIRPRVKAWGKAGYPGVTGITKRLLEHWYNPEERENTRFFFCQLEAIETLIWLAEAPASEKVGIEIPSDGGLFRRLCSKMATGSGKTIVMAMLIAWHTLNKVTYPQDKRFAKHFLVIAPGLTVRSRLRVLIPSEDDSYYKEFNVVPPGLTEKLNQAKVLIRNWHVLNWETDEKLAKKKTVDKRGAKSDEAYVREVLGEIANARNILVINDEAHHAWRVTPGAAALSKEELDEATKWVGGLDRINKARGILVCHDFSATPFVPSGRQSTEEALFGWIVSDFGLNDAIESGLVKTPRVVIRDDGRLSKDHKSRFYHIYNDDEVKDDLNRKALEQEPLPDLVTNGYYLLGKDWLETYRSWQSRGMPTPPVMISVANRTETAARIKYAFDHKKIRIDELCVPERTLHIDSKVLEMAEAQEEPLVAAEVISEDEEATNGGARKLTKKEQAELLRSTVDTVGQFGKPGEGIQNVISVGMLSEGWDAKTVTHVMGLRAFSSQLLCEQVVGRGLRRTSYDVDEKTKLFKAEYVNIFGVPFTFMPHESQEDGPPPPPPPPKTRIEPLVEKNEFEISWPNVIRIDHVYNRMLRLDIETMPRLELSAFDTPKIAELAPVVDGKPDLSKISEIDLEELGRRFRMQKIVFETSLELYDLMRTTWKGNRETLFAQLIPLVEKFIVSNKLAISPPLFGLDEIRKRILITLNMSKVVQHVWEQIRFENTESIQPVFDTEKPIRSTGDMQAWYTARPCERTKRSHINFCVYDSGWENTESFELDRNPNVDAWVKNDHLGFEIIYIFKGVVKKYRPDFIVKLKSGEHLILETKGQPSEKDKAKRGFLDEWVRAVNQHGGFGKWRAERSEHPDDLVEILSPKRN